MDTTKLPSEWVVPDGVPGSAVTPSGHVSVYPQPEEEGIPKSSVIGKWKFPKQFSALPPEPLVGPDLPLAPVLPSFNPFPSMLPDVGPLTFPTPPLGFGEVGGPDMAPNPVLQAPAYLPGPRATIPEAHWVIHPFHIWHRPRPPAYRPSRASQGGASHSYSGVDAAAAADDPFANLPFVDEDVWVNFPATDTSSDAQPDWMTACGPYCDEAVPLGGWALDLPGGGEFEFGGRLVPAPGI